MADSTRHLRERKNTAFIMLFILVIASTGLVALTGDWLMAAPAIGGALGLVMQYFGGPRLQGDVARLMKASADLSVAPVKLGRLNTTQRVVVKAASDKKAAVVIPVLRKGQPVFRDEDYDAVEASLRKNPIGGPVADQMRALLAAPEADRAAMVAALPQVTLLSSDI